MISDKKLEALIATEFPQREGLIYLNHAGVGPWPKRTSEAIKRFAEENIIQGPVDYPHWLKVEESLREQLRQWWKWHRHPKFLLIVSLRSRICGME